MQVVRNFVIELLLHCTRAFKATWSNNIVAVFPQNLAHLHREVAVLSVICLSPILNNAEQKAACNWFASFRRSGYHVAEMITEESFFTRSL